MFDVAIATCDPLPEPDRDHRPLVEGLEAKGMSVVTWAWDDEGVRWDEASVVIPRSTWDYYRRYRDFLGWIKKVEEVATLLNPGEVIRWNSHKSYLLSLPMRGIPVVPTAAIERGASVNLEEICEYEGWTKVVAKPAVGAGSYEAHELERGSEGEEVFGRLLRERDMLVQPFMESIHDHGERSLIFVDGKYTHGVRKAPRFSGEEESVEVLDSPTEREYEVARGAMDAIDQPLLYGRVDLITDEGGAPKVAELELIEPSLFFRFQPSSVARLAESVANYL